MSFPWMFSGVRQEWACLWKSTSSSQLFPGLIWRRFHITTHDITHIHKIQWKLFVLCFLHLQWGQPFQGHQRTSTDDHWGCYGRAAWSIKKEWRQDRSLWSACTADRWTICNIVQNPGCEVCRWCLKHWRGQRKRFSQCSRSSPDGSELGEGRRWQSGSPQCQVWRQTGVGPITGCTRGVQMKKDQLLQGLPQVWVPHRMFSTALALFQLQRQVEHILHNPTRLVSAGLEELGVDAL